MKRQVRLQAMPDPHADAVRSAFAQQAAGFEDHRLNRVFTSDADWMFARLELNADDLVLDVAAGTGHVARALAPSVRSVVALDATPEMLATGKAQADRAGLTNVVFMRGDAAVLPFLDDSFAVVVSRFAVHHFAEPGLPMAEMARCLAPGGRTAVADMVADEDPSIAEAQHRLERLRDPSHTRMLAAPELAQLLAGAGLASVSVEVRDVERPLAPWLAHAATHAQAADRIRDELRAELDGGPETGFRPRERDGELHFTQSFASVMATKPVR